MIDYILKFKFVVDSGANKPEMLEINFVDVDFNDPNPPITAPQFEFTNEDAYEYVINLQSIHPSNPYFKHSLGVDKEYKIKNNLTGSEKDIAYIYIISKSRLRILTIPAI